MFSDMVFFLTAAQKGAKGGVRSGRRLSGKRGSMADPRSTGKGRAMAFGSGITGRKSDAEAGVARSGPSGIPLTEPAGESQE